MERKLYRTEGKDAMLIGVCGGLAEYFRVVPTIVRVVLVLLVWFKGLSLWLYLLAAILLPKKSTVYPDY